MQLCLKNGGSQNYEAWKNENAPDLNRVSKKINALLTRSEDLLIKDSDAFVFDFLV